MDADAEYVLQHVSRLARLQLSDEERQKFTKQIQDVLDLFNKVASANVEGEPAYHCIEAENGLRPDKPVKFDWDPLANAKHVEGKYIKSPKIV